MSQFAQGQLLEFLYAALRSPHGVIVHTTGTLTEIRQRLYVARREANDPDLKCLAICQSPSNPSDIWIIKKEPGGASD